MKTTENEIVPLIETFLLSKEYYSRTNFPGFKGFLRGLFNPRKIKHIGLAPINLRLDPGEILGVLGPNGAGKSTLIKLLTGIQNPTKGEIKVLGCRPSERSKTFLREIGVVFGHKSSLWWDLPVIASFESIRLIYGISQNQYQKQLATLMKALDLSMNLLNRPVRVLSLGERVKCEVLGALLHEPKILFLDEPTVGLDITSRSELRILLKQYAVEKNVGIILTSHDVGDIETCCSRVLLINHGKIMFNGNLNSLKNNFSDVVRLQIRANENVFSTIEKNMICEELNSFVTHGSEIKISNELIEATIQKKTTRAAMKIITDIDLNISIEVRSPDLEEILLHHFDQFRSSIN